MHFGDNVCISGIFRVQDNANICILGIMYAFQRYFEFKTTLIYAFGGYFEFMGIYRVNGDISSYHLLILHCKIMTVSHVTHLSFHGDCTNNYECPEGWDVQK